MEAADITYKILPSVADQGKGEGWDIGNGLASSSLLIHSDTTDGSTTFVDTVGTHTPAVGAADVEHDTAQSRFGKTSILFDGDSGYLTVPDHADWNFFASEFTIDFWIRFNTLPSNSQMRLFTQYVNADNYISFFCAEFTTVTLDFLVRGGGTDDVLFQKIWSGASANQWYHVALIRGWGGNTNDYAVTVNGTQIGTTETDASNHADLGAALEIGRLGDNTDFFDGWLDEYRVTKGLARWTKNFIPPYGSYR